MAQDDVRKKKSVTAAAILDCRQTVSTEHAQSTEQQFACTEQQFTSRGLGKRVEQVYVNNFKM